MSWERHPWTTASLSETLTHPSRVTPDKWLKYSSSLVAGSRKEGLVVHFVGCGWVQVWFWMCLSGTYWIIALLHHISFLWFTYRKYTHCESREDWRHRENNSYSWMTPIKYEWCWPIKQVLHSFQRPVCQLIHPCQGTWFGLLWDIIIESRCLA